MTRIECPSCNQKYSVEESLLGFEVQCSACNTIFIAQKKAPIKLQLPNEFKTQAANVCAKENTIDSSAKEHKTNLSNETESIILNDSSTPKTANAWRRFGARFIDMSIETYICSFTLIFILYIFVDIENNTLLKVINWLVDCLISPILAILIDSIVYAIFKGTFGKWLLGVEVVEEDNQQKPTRMRYFIRNMYVYCAGIGFNLPIVALCTFIFQYNRVSKGKKTTYDQKLRFNSIVNNNSLSKTIVGIVLVTIFVVLRIVFQVSSLK